MSQFDCDPRKRAAILRERKFDLLDMALVFDDLDRLEEVDRRLNYGEERVITIGRAMGRIFTVVYTVRDPIIWLITAWSSNRKERNRYANR